MSHANNLFAVPANVRAFAHLDVGSIVAASGEWPVHKLLIPPEVVERVTRRAGRAHPFDTIDPAKTAFLVIDMQNFFMKPGFMGEVSLARVIVPNVGWQLRCASEAVMWSG